MSGLRVLRTVAFGVAYLSFGGATLLSIDEIAHTDLNAGRQQRKVVQITSITTSHAKALRALER